ncbi:HNH endonuclease [Microbispora hainanensis]|uniref:HNH endonuclease signature motif containing protein n=1 Tax=Microbispora hainanensis TaxID=568844 RepID=UPI002E2CCE47|nr:HNH endonuclease [Microbispora hainanensis]
MAIPDGLAVIPPGAELAGVLAGIAVERVSGFDTVEVLKAAYRQSCHDRAWFLRVLLEVGLREAWSGDSVVRLQTPEEFAPDEARAALVWSRRRADSAFELAWNLHRRLPVLGEAMLEGVLDEPRAVAFIRWTSGLTDAQAGWVCERLVPRAAGWTVGELVEHVQRMVLAIDPDWAEKRYTEAVRRRRVAGMRNDDGTATVSGLDLPVERAVAGCERIDELARACKRAGDRRPIDHIRADLFLGSLDGTFEGLTDEQIVTHVLAHPLVEPGDPTPGDTSDDIPSSTGSADDPAGSSDAATGKPDAPAGTTASPASSAGTPTGEPKHERERDYERRSGNGPEPEDGHGHGRRVAPEPERGHAQSAAPQPGTEQRPSTGATPAYERDRSAASEPAAEHQRRLSTGPESEHEHGRDQVTAPAPEPEHEHEHERGQSAPPEPGPEHERGHDNSAAPEPEDGNAYAHGRRGAPEPRQEREHGQGTAPEPGTEQRPSTGATPAYEHDQSAAPEPEDGHTHTHGRRAAPESERGHDQSAAPESESESEGGRGCGELQRSQGRLGGGPGATSWSVPEIRVELTTLLGHDEHPAHLPGWGMVHAAQARRIVTGMLGGQWRYAICADDGHLLLAGITRQRPCPPAQRPPRDMRRGGIVELQITLTQLHRLAAAPATTGAWAPLIADLTRQAHAQLGTTPATGSPHPAAARHPGRSCDPAAAHAPAGSGDPAMLGEQTDPAHTADITGTANTAGAVSTTDAVGTAGAVNTTGAARTANADSAGAANTTGVANTADVVNVANAAGAAGTAGVANTANGADRRHADAALRRYVQIRGRVCSWPGCRMPATRTDQDHIQAWADNGATTAANLHLACRHDHRAKHLGGWRVTTAGPHLIIWTSPLRHPYRSPLPKIIQPVPDPQPRTWPDAPPGRLPADLPGAPDTIMAPPCPPPSPTAQTPAETPAQPTRRHATHAAGAGSPGAKEHDDSRSKDDESGGTLIQRDLETPPF